MRKIFESEEYQKILNDIQTALDNFKNEYGTTGYSINRRIDQASIIFFFDKSLTEQITWAIQKAPNSIDKYSDIIKKSLYKSRGGEYWISLKFDVIDDTNLLEITSPFPMMVKDRVVKSEKVIESVLDILKPAFSWISATGKLYKFSSLDEETIMEYFSDMFDDSEDYSVHVKETMGINLYEIAVSTKTIHKGDEGGFIFIDEDVMGLFRDLPNVIRHIQSEYPVNISINTSRPNRERHPDKSETFYKSQAFILRVVLMPVMHFLSRNYF